MDQFKNMSLIRFSGQSLMMTLNLKFDRHLAENKAYRIFLFSNSKNENISKKVKNIYNSSSCWEEY